MAKQSRRMGEARESVDSTKRYEVPEAVRVLKGFKKVKFDETVEIAVNLGIDPRQTDQLVRGSVSLPKGIGKEVKVLVFAEGEQAEAAEAAGADFVGTDDLVKRIQDGWLGFDVAITSPSMMRVVGRLGRVLGPQGLMPSPKSGTVTDNIPQAVQEFKAGKVEYRSDAGGNVHAPVGRVSFSDDDLIVNVSAFLDHMRAVRPASVKGTFLRKAAICSSMSPGVKLAV